MSALNLFNSLKNATAQVEELPPDLMPLGKDLVSYLSLAVDFHLKLNLDSFNVHQSVVYSSEDFKRFNKALIDAEKTITKLLDNPSLYKAYNPIRKSIHVALENLTNMRENWGSRINQYAYILGKHTNNVKFLMAQGLIPALATSHGECYGFSVAYAATKDAKQDVKALSFGEMVSNWQFSQLFKDSKNSYLFKLKFEYFKNTSSEKDNEYFFRKSLTKVEYQPDLHNQAANIAACAKKHSGKHLLLTLYGVLGGHATYLQYTPQGKWEYFDSNFGALQWDSEDEFKAFYYDLYTSSTYKKFSLHSYQLSSLTKECPMNTWSGKLRILLTGPRYLGGQLLYFLVKCSLVALLAYWIAPLALPWYLCNAIAVISYFVISKVSSSGFNGLLGIPRYIHFNLHRLFSIFQKTEENTPTKNHSTSTLLNTFVKGLPDATSFSEKPDDELLAKRILKKVQNYALQQQWHTYSFFSVGGGVTRKFDLVHKKLKTRTPHFVTQQLDIINKAKHLGKWSEALESVVAIGKKAAKQENFYRHANTKQYYGLFSAGSWQAIDFAFPKVEMTDNKNAVIASDESWGINTYTKPYYS